MAHRARQEPIRGLKPENLRSKSLSSPKPKPLNPKAPTSKTRKSEEPFAASAPSFFAPGRLSPEAGQSLSSGFVDAEDEGFGELGFGVRTSKGGSFQRLGSPSPGLQVRVYVKVSGLRGSVAVASTAGWIGGFRSAVRLEPP